MKIEVLYFEGCPNHKPAVALVHEVLADLALSEEVYEVEIRNPDEASTHRFLGSPSVHVDGLDIEPEARDQTDYSFSCRTYNGQGIPLREWIVAALSA